MMIIIMIIYKNESWKSSLTEWRVKTYVKRKVIGSRIGSFSREEKKFFFAFLFLILLVLIAHAVSKNLSTRK